MGGFGVGFEFSSAGNAGINYVFHKNLTAEAGYGYTWANCRRNGVVWDMNTYGPYISVGLLF